MYSAKHREYQLVTKSTVLCFLTHVIFTMSIFSTVVCPRCAPELGAQCKFGWHAKKIFQRLCQQLQNRVGAYATSLNSLSLLLFKTYSIVTCFFVSYLLRTDTITTAYGYSRFGSVPQRSCREEPSGLLVLGYYNLDRMPFLSPSGMV